MPSTLYASVTLLAAAHALLRRLPDFAMPGRRRLPARLTSPAPVALPDAEGSAGDLASAAAAPAHGRHIRPAVRVLRLVEHGQSTAQVGRMVISGRMADVCAELDRMVAREAALRPGH